MAEEPEAAFGARKGWTPPSVDRPVATLMVVAAVVVFGWVSLRQMPVDLMPELSYPTVTVRTEYEGAAPEEVEDAVTRPIEEYLGTVEGMVGMSSVSRAGSNDVVFRFAWNTDLDVAIQKIRERISLIEFPDDAEPPLILRYDPTLDPIFELAVTSGTSSAAELRTYVEEEVERELEELEGVAMVRVTGGEEAVVRVALDERRMETLGITPALVSQRLEMENVNVAGGRLYEGEIEYLVRTVNEFGGVDDIGAVVLTAAGNGIVRVRDIATVETAVREREVLTRVDGRPSVEIAVYKDADANLVAVADRVRERVYGDRGGEEDGAAPDGSGESDGSGAANGEVEAGAEGSGEAGRPGDGAGRGRGPGMAAGPDTSLAGLAPEGTRFEVLTDQSQYVQAAISEVTRTALLGGLCAIVVLFVFLRRPFATFVIGLAIPLSVVATFAPLRMLGVSLNIMSLGGIALGIGMLVDNAIVVLESIVRCREEGDEARAAAIRGTAEVAGAVTASTLTTVAVFLPIVFVEGIAGQLFGDLGIAVVLSLFASLAFALFFVPMMSVLPERLSTEGSSPKQVFSELVGSSAWTTVRADVAWARERTAGRPAAWLYAGPVMVYSVVRFVVWAPIEAVARAVLGVGFALAAVVGVVVAVVARVLGRIIDLPLAGFARAMELFTDGYRAFLRAALSARLLVIGIAGLAMWWAVSVYPSLGMQLIPELKQGVFTAEIALPVGTRLDQTSAVVGRVEEALGASPDVARAAAFIGRDDSDLEASERGEHTASITVVVAPDRSLEAAEERALEALRSVLAAEPAVQYDIVRPTLFSLAAPLVVEIRGEDLEALRTSAARVEQLVAATPGVADVRSSAREGFPEVRVRFHRERLAALGLDVRTVAEVIRAKVQGDVPTELRAGDRTVEIDVALDRADLQDLRALESMVVAFVEPAADASTAAVGSMDAAALDATSLADAGPVGRPIRLSAVADVSVERGPAEIRHVDGQRAAVVSASSSVLDLRASVDAVRSRLGEAQLSQGQLALVTGQSEEMDAARRSLGLALALAVFLVYVVMASNFESLIGPLVILVTIPLALVGVAAVLAATNTPVSIVVLIGVIVLAGIVVNNAIVLVDYVLTLRRRGMALREAVIEACAIRLRPVTITATTTVLGLLPMALGLGEGAEIRRPLAWTVIAGLSVGTVLTLVVIPAVYDLVARRGPVGETEA